MPGHAPHLTRRALLGGMLGTAGLGASGFGPLARLAFGQPAGAPDLHYIFCYFGGGWDILLGLDPKDPVRFDEASLGDTLIQPAYDQLRSSSGELVRGSESMVFGPHIGALARHASKLAVVRGMSMETLTHEAGRRRFLTGKAPSGLQARGSSAATHLAAQLGREAPIPNLAVRVEAFNVDQPSYATALSASGVPDLLRALAPEGEALDPAARGALDRFLGRAARCRRDRRSPVARSAHASRVKAAEMVRSGLDEAFDFLADTPEMEALRDHYGIARRRSALASYEARAALAATAIKAGVTKVASIEITGGLDTHFDEWSTDQGPRQERGFDLMARLIEDLERSPYPGGGGQSWLDRTVIVGFSEFSRTPRLNDRGGRDHSLTNACVLAGAGIRGGQVIGASSDVGMEPVAIDLDTGRPDRGGEAPKPEHVIQALFESAGLGGDPADLRARPLAALQKPV